MIASTLDTLPDQKVRKVIGVVTGHSWVPLSKISGLFYESMDDEDCDRRIRKMHEKAINKMTEDASEHYQADAVLGVTVELSNLKVSLGGEFQEIVVATATGTAVRTN